MTSDLPTLYRLGGVPQGWPIHPDYLIEDGWLVPVTEPLLTREEAANEMVMFFNQYCDDAPYWPDFDAALKWLGDRR